MGGEAGMTLVKDQIVDWHQQLFKNSDIFRKATKFGEEAGEVQGAITKREEGRATTQDIIDEIGDALICLTVILNDTDPSRDIEDVRVERFREIRTRHPGYSPKAADDG